MANRLPMEHAFLRAYDAHADAIFRHCFLRVRDRGTAEDLVQETFLKTWAYLADGKPVDNLKAFLFRVANNLIVDTSRRKRETIDIDELCVSGREPGEDTRGRLAEYLDGKEALARLDQLDDAHREVLLLTYVDGLRPKEIAEVLGENANAVTVRLHRAKKKLKDLL